MLMLAKKFISNFKNMANIEQIKTAYEVLNLSPQQIAEDQDLDIVAVKSALIQASSKYRKDCGHEPEEVDDGLNFTNEDLRHVNAEILQLALGAESEELRGKMCMYVRDDKKGRKEVIKAVQNNTTFNLLNFNEQLREARSAANSLKQKLINI